MFLDRITKETTDISRAVLDLSWWLDAGETLTTVVSSEILVGMFGWSEPPYPPLGGLQPFDITPLEFDRPVEIDDTGTQLIVFVNTGSPGIAYTCQFVLDGTSTRRVTIEMGVQVTGIPVGSMPGPIPSWLAVTVSDTPPQNPQPGQLWFDSVNAELYVWYVDPTSAEWTIANAVGGGSGNIIINPVPDNTYLLLTGGTVTGTITGTAFHVFRNSVISTAPDFTLQCYINYTGGTYTGPDQILAANVLVISGDNVTTPATGAAGGIQNTYIGYDFGGSAVTGHRTGLFTNLACSATTGNTGTAPKFYTAIGAQTIGRVNDNGTAGAPVGNAFGFNFLARLHPGATYWNSAVGGEIDVEVSAGASVAYKQGFKIVLWGTDAVRGSACDYAIGFGTSVGAGTSTWATGIAFVSPDGHSPWASDSVLIGTPYAALGGSHAFVADRGVDLSNFTFGTAAFKSAGFMVDGLGHVAPLLVNAVDETAAIAAGVPSKALYRNGNVVLVRLT